MCSSDLVAQNVQRKIARQQDLAGNLDALALSYENDAVPDVLARVTTKAQVDALLQEKFPTGDREALSRLKAAGITSAAKFNEAQRELEDLSPRGGAGRPA